MADEKESSSKYMYCMTFNLDRFLLQRKVCLIFGPECLRVIQGEKIVDVFQHHCQHGDEAATDAPKCTQMHPALFYSVQHLKSLRFNG